MIKPYEVTVAEINDKTLLVNAENRDDALCRAIDAYEAGEYGFNDCPDFEVLDVRPATDTFYQINSPGYTEDEDDEFDDFLIEDEDEDEDIIFTCERCELKESCNNETKLRHMLEMLLEEFKERVDMVCATYGEDQ